MENILYRGKRKNDNEWVYGYYAEFKCWLDERPVYAIIPTDRTLYPHSEIEEWYEVIPETVGRLLRHADYDGHYEFDRIFQNDIIAMWNCKADIDHIDPIAIALVQDEHSVMEKGLGRWFPQDTTRIRVIGNAYDNPELLQGHSLNHFVNGLNDYSGDCTEYTKRHRYLSDKYNIHGAHACCYMCNFENDYICHKFNGGCKEIDTCRKIREAGD